MKKILIALMAVMITIGLVGIGTYAYFSDTETSTGNIFTAGTLDIKLWGSDWEDSVTGTWTFDNMAPGDVVEETLYVRNAGSVPINCLLFDMDVTEEADGASDGKHLDDYLKVVRVCVDINRVDIDKCCYDFDEYIRVFCAHNNMDPCNADMFIPYCVDSLEPGDELSIYYKFEFEDTGSPQNNAQGDSVTMRLKLEGRSTTCEYSCP